MTKDRPMYRKIYQKELAEEITGFNMDTIRARMRRQGITLAEAIRQIIKEKA